MKKNMKKLAVLALTAVMSAGLLAGCGGSGSSGSEGSGSSSGDKTAITVFNSKMEIQGQLEEMAEKYSEEKGVDVEVYYSNDTVAAHLATRYSSNEPYTLSMVDAKDVYALAEEHALDLTGEDWVSNTTQAISVNDKVYGFPVCIEARGIIYNADAIEKATGEAFDPTAIKTTEDLKALVDKMIAGGMATPVGVMKEDWSLAGHFLSEVYEQHDDPDAFIAGVKDGSIDLAKDDDTYLRGKHAATLWFLLKQGKIAKIEGLDAWKDDPCAIENIQRLHEGDEVLPEWIGNEKQVLTRMYLVCDTKEQLAERLKHYMATVHVYNEAGEDLCLKGFDVDKALGL